MERRVFLGGGILQRWNKSKMQKKACHCSESHFTITENDSDFFLHEVWHFLHFSPTTANQIESAVIIMPACVLKVDALHNRRIDSFFCNVKNIQPLRKKNEIDLQSNISFGRNSEISIELSCHCFVKNSNFPFLPPSNKRLLFATCKKTQLEKWKSLTSKETEMKCEWKCRCSGMRFMRIMGFSGFYRLETECSYNMDAPHRMHFEFYMENLRNFLFIFQYNLCALRICCAEHINCMNTWQIKWIFSCKVCASVHVASMKRIYESLFDCKTLSQMNTSKGGWNASECFQRNEKNENSFGVIDASFSFFWW